MFFERTIVYRLSQFPSESYIAIQFGQIHLHCDGGPLPQPMDGEKIGNTGELWISMDFQAGFRSAGGFREFAKITGEFAKITGEFWGTPKLASNFGKLASNFGKLAKAPGTPKACLKIHGNP